MEAIRQDESGSVLVRANNGLQVWVDVWEDDGELMADWNKYIFHLNNKEDVKIKKFQEDNGNFDEATSVAISFYENNLK